MTEVTAGDPPKTGGKKGLILLAAVVALAAAAGFGAGTTGLVPLPFGPKPAGEPQAADRGQPAGPTPAPAFHRLPELIIPLGRTASSQFLRTRLYLEIDPAAAERVRQTEPRIMDTLNVFLRSVDERDVASILAMETLRAELLRRVRLVTGNGAVRAVLIGEFLLR